ncbi:hypothetical protein ACF1AB_16595 [Streptomyces sp. NPDC014846]|uniref:hypothetical protein n=1 Tax=Streptomyces sp. NPDC014846 TaxID=3364922 RepID=UPI0036F52232
MGNVNTHADASTVLPLSSKVSRKERAAVLLALGGTSTIAGRALDVDPSTVRRWRQTPGFRATVTDLRLRLIGDDAAATLAAVVASQGGGGE